LKLITAFDQTFRPIEAECSQLKITDDGSGISMNIAVQIDKSKQAWQYNVYIDFFSHETQIDLASISSDIIVKLLRKYKDSISDSIIGVKEGSDYTKSKRNKSLMTAVIKSARGLEHIGTFLEEPRSITLCTIDHSSEEVIAKTTLKLDADNITIISSNILNNEMLSRPFLLLHTYNLMVAYGLFGHQLKEFSKILGIFKYITKILSFFPSAITFTTSIFHGLAQGSLPILVSSSALTAILYIYAPKYLFRYIPDLFKIIPRFYIYLMKRKLLVARF
jgi:hypothetical protein